MIRPNPIEVGLREKKTRNPCVVLKYRYHLNIIYLYMYIHIKQSLTESLIFSQFLEMLKKGAMLALVCGPMNLNRKNIAEVFFNHYFSVRGKSFI